MPASPWDLLVVGELNPDVVVAAPAGEIAFGQVEQWVDSALITLGSSGAITAAAAAAQGLRVRFCGMVGDDATGAMTVGLLADHGVDVSLVVRRAGEATGVTVVLTRPGGDRAMLTFPGVMTTFRAADLPPDWSDGVRHVHVSSLYLQVGLAPGVPALLTAARADGATTSLDPGWDPADDWRSALPALPAVDFLLPNEAECLRMARAGGWSGPGRSGSGSWGPGQPGTGDGSRQIQAPGPAEVESAAAALAQAGPTVAVKRGAAGALAVTPGTVTEVTGAAREPVDTTGAGDSFDAGFLAAMLAGAPLPECLARGAASGALSVTGAGGTGRLASSAEARHGAAALSVRVRERIPAGGRSPAGPHPTDSVTRSRP